MVSKVGSQDLRLQTGFELAPRKRKTPAARDYGCGISTTRLFIRPRSGGPYQHERLNNRPGAPLLDKKDARNLADMPLTALRS